LDFAILLNFGFGILHFAAHTKNETNFCDTQLGEIADSCPSTSIGLGTSTAVKTLTPSTTPAHRLVPPWHTAALAVRRLHAVAPAGSFGSEAQLCVPRH